MRRGERGVRRSARRRKRSESDIIFTFSTKVFSVIDDGNEIVSASSSISKLNKIITR